MSMAAALFVGVAAGLVIGRRWSILVTPTVFVIVFELARLGIDGFTVGADATLEQDFVVVTWEQRGAGKSYSALDPVETLTLEQTVADTIEVSNYLRDRFDEDKIYLVGNSWGTIPGVLAVQQHPELFHAYVGTGQMVSPQNTDIMFYEDTLAWAKQTGNDALATTLRQNGPPYCACVFNLILLKDNPTTT